MEIHVRVPVRITLTGEPGADELAALTGRLTALVAGRLAQAERQLGRHRRTAPWAAGGEGVQEAHDPGRDVAGGYALPSYADAGRRTGVPVRGREPWTVVGTARARIEVGRFLGYVAEVLRQPFPQAALYASLAGTVRPVDVWIVRLDKRYVPEELGTELVARSTPAERGDKESRRAGEKEGRTEPAWALAASAAALHRLTEADESGTLATRMPRLPPRHVVFASMRLPRVDLTDVVVLGSARPVPMTVRGAGFCVDRTVFERATGIPWSRYAEEYASELTTVWTQPAVLRPDSNPLRTPAGIEREALFLLLDRHAGDGPPHRVPAAALFVAEGEVFPGLPESVRRRTEWPAEAGERVLYCRAWFDLSPETVGAAFFRPRARELVAALLPLLGGDRFGDALDTLLTESTPHERGRFGSRFAHVLAELEQLGKLGEFFDRADATRRFALRLRLLQRCETTPYAHHERVRALRAALSQERAATTAHAYTPGGPGQGAIQLDRRPSGTVRAGQLLGDADILYRKSLGAQRPKPGRAEALRAELLAQRARLVEDVLTGRDRQAYSEAEFAALAVERAARAARITADDFEEVEVEYGIRLLEVLATQQQGLPSYDVRFEIVSRVVGGGDTWRCAAGPSTEPVGEFEARLVQWRLGRAGDLYRIAGFAVVAVGGLALAWEAGVVASLVRLGGGGTAVRVGVGLSVDAYLLRTLLADEEVTVGGFAEAAVDGYLGTIGFRIGGGLGGWAGSRIGTATLRARITSWITAKLLTGTVGGGTTGALAVFAHDVVTVAFQDGQWSGIDTYVRRMEFDAVVGIVGVFVAEPVLRALLTRAGPTLVKAALLTRLLRDEGVTAERWAEAMALTRRRMEQTMGQGLSAAEARAWTRALSERVDEAAEGLAHGRTPLGTRPPAAEPVAEPPGTRAASGRPPGARPPGASVRPAAPATRWPSWQELKKASLVDREAALDRAWYERARPEELAAREAGDPVAKEYLDEAWGGRHRPYRPERPTDPAVQERLREDLRAARALVEAERRRLEAAGLRKPATPERAGFEERSTVGGKQEVPATAKTAAGYEGTVAVARSDIPALAGESFAGGSPRALGSYDPAHGIRPPENVVVPQAHGHAEQDLGQRLDARLNRLTGEERAAARGRTVYIRVDQEVCSVCAAALGGGPRAGVLARLSARHPDIVFEVTADDVSTVYRIVGGRRVP
ncbi:hypothetical protein ACLVWQ_02305 [Streptomyces sp. CWNU-52B]|uniref:hypothetical protein n=1 Tax=unclassified Streptomyces TaxID=2593676 RepID=UPI0039BF515E